MLTWQSSERVGDRYGAIYFAETGCAMPPGFGDTPANQSSWTLDQAAIDASVGKRGTLRAIAIETRESPHIGDMFHGVVPTTPDVGETMVLGTGTLGLDGAPAEDSSIQFLLRPADGRSTLWMDIRALYRCHEQTVQLWFDVEPERAS